MKKNNKGFSLVELIIVIAIMAVLVGILAPQYLKYVESGRQSTDMDNVVELMGAAEAFAADSDEGLASDITITITGNKITVAGPADLTKTGGHLEDLGLKATMDCKSKGWTDGVKLTYQSSNLQWKIEGTTKNGKKPNKDMATVLAK